MNDYEIYGMMLICLENACIPFQGKIMNFEIWYEMNAMSCMWWVFNVHYGLNTRMVYKND